MKMVFLFLITLCSAMLHAGDTSSAPYNPQPLPKPHPLEPLIQRDGHTCGFLALSAIYTSYGLEPEGMNLRRRLGTDVPLVPFMSDTTGTVQPDYFRVLMQDGFKVQTVKGGDLESRDAIIKHLEKGHFALTLIKRRENGHLHWVVMTAYADGIVDVGDSLRPEIYKEPLDDFLENHIQNVLLLTPKKPNPLVAIGPPHVLGIINMLEPWRGQVLVISLCLLAMLVMFLARKKLFALEPAGE